MMWNPLVLSCIDNYEMDMIPFEVGWIVSNSVETHEFGAYTIILSYQRYLTTGFTFWNYYITFKIPPVLANIKYQLSNIKLVLTTQNNSIL